MLFTVSKMADLTGLDRRTITKRLSGVAPDEDGRYESSVALKALYSPDALDGAQEKAKLDLARRELCEIRKAELQKTLIPAEIVQRHWEFMAGNVRAKLLNLPGRLAVEIGDPDKSIETKAKRLVYEALKELAANGAPHG